VMALPKDSDGRVRHWKTIDEPLKPIKEPFSPGSLLFITGGVHRGISGKTVMKQGDNVVVLLPSDEKVIVNIKDLKELEDNEPLPSLPDNNTPADSASKITPAVIPTTTTDTPPLVTPSASSSSRKHKKHKSSKEKHKKKKKDTKSSSKKHKKRKRSPSTSSESSDAGSKPPPPPEFPATKEFRWITPDIRVKICSKSISEGRYYCKSGWIIDILPENRCVVRLEDSGILLENIRQSDLETIVPAASGSVKIVRGEYCGEIGTVYEKNPARNEVYVQLEDNLDICKLSYDDVAQIRS